MDELTLIMLMEEVKMHEDSMNDAFSDKDLQISEYHFQAAQGILSRVSQSDYIKYKSL